MEYYAALKRKEIPSPTTWMNLKDTMLNEISHKRTNTVTYVRSPK